MATHTDSMAVERADQVTHARLISSARHADTSDLAWRFLEAAHVLGQMNVRLHLRTHAAMFGLAWRTLNRRELVGQAFRLVLVPLGHLTQRLPEGNPGTSGISAFQALPVRDELTALISQARRSSGR